MFYIAELLLFRGCGFLSHTLDKAQYFVFPKIYFGVCLLLLLMFCCFCQEYPSAWGWVRPTCLGLFSPTQEVSFPPAQSLNQYLVPLTNGHFMLYLDHGLKLQRHFGAWFPHEQQESLPPVRTVLFVFHFFSEHCTIRSDSFHLSFPAPPFKGNTVKFFSRGTCLISQTLEVAHTGSFPLHARNGVNMPRGMMCFTLFSAWKLRRNHKSWVYGTSRLL